MRPRQGQYVIMFYFLWPGNVQLYGQAFNLHYISAMSSFFSSMTQLKDSLFGSNNALVSQSLQEKNV